ncbi:uncharacterized protein LOC115017603 [Cottoperca gobio]|uniref:Uncharacterized protein LOC115017603 n=1 Tax=Cottoperca gobio TaxID=56716 RepID=A0A6J2QY14_COTGO|nr:uncharacterized protein LOC115017603 [Cottoperca gobio]
MKLSDSGFTKKKRTFVYTAKASKPQVQGKETQSQKMDSSGIPDSGQEVDKKQLGKAIDEADCCTLGKHEMQKQGNFAEDNLPPSVQAKAQDLEMSQLCKEFAQDFSQMPYPGKLSKEAEDTPQHDFSPSACLSALKRAKQKAMQANLHYACNGVSDSGFQSAVADSTHMTASSFVLPSSEINSQSQQRPGFETDIHRIPPFTSANKRNGRAHLDDLLQEAETDAKLSTAIKESQTLGPFREIKSRIVSPSAQQPSSGKGTCDNINCIVLNCHAHGSLPEKTTVSLPFIHASGFKTASDRGIHISSANLQRANCLFEEAEGESTLSDQPIKCTHDTKDEMSRGSVKNPSNSNQPPSLSAKHVDTSGLLTASQKADVTELCTLLEEADSQFEFTQFKTAKLKQHCEDNATSPQQVDKELDLDFLSGIDFDDSFSSEAEKHLAVTVRHDKMTVVSDGKTNCETSDVTSKSTALSSSSAIKNENSSTEVTFSSEGSSRILSSRTQSCAHRNKQAGEPTSFSWCGI